jgi:chromosome segregation ATPase
MTFKKNEIEFESDKVKAYVQQLQSENGILRQANEEKNELLIKLGCPTKATAKRKVLCLQQQLDQLKAEVKSKTEYIQEQRDIINQYSKEIEMYKKCQGKRASKREEELKAENDNIKKTFDGLFKVQYKLADNNKKLRQCLTEIKEIADWKNEYWSLGIDDYKNMADEILEKISEVENG